MTNKKIVVLVVLLLIAFFIWKTDFSKFNLSDFIHKFSSANGIKGKIVYIYEPLINGKLDIHRTEIYIMNPDGTGKRQLTYNNFYDTMPKLSPDGKRVVFVSARTPSGGVPLLGMIPSFSHQIYIINTDGTGERQLTFSEGNCLYPRWLSNEKIVFLSQDSEGEYRWMVMNVDNGNIQSLDEYLGFHIPGNPYFSPDGSKIAYTIESGTGSSRKSQIWIINRDGTGKRQLTYGECDESPAWSPDGKKIAYSSRYVVDMDYVGPSPRFAIYVIDVDSGNIRQLTDDGIRPCWSPDGQKIVFEKYWGNGILVMDADGKNKKWIAPKSMRDLTRFRTGKIVDLYMWPDWR